MNALPVLTRRSIPGALDFMLHLNAADKAVNSGDPNEAEKQIDQAVACNPTMGGVIANSFLRANDLQGAIELYSKVIDAPGVDPKVRALSLNDIGMAFSRLGNREFAIRCFRDALELQRNSAEIWYNLGLAEAWMGNWQAKIHCIDRALRLRPTMHDAYFSRATSLLTVGDLVNGFREYESRWKARLVKPTLPISELQRVQQAAGKTVYLYSEQGVGDTVQMLRYVPMMKQVAKRVLVAVQPQVLTLARHFGHADEFMDYADFLELMEKPVIDHREYFALPLMSLPKLFGTAESTIPPAPYIPTPEPLALEGKFRVGLVWAGSPDHTDDKWRSIPFKLFAPILAVEGPTFYSLQVGPKKLDGLICDEPLRQLSLGSYLDTARAIAGLDLVVSVDTSVVHLAGAMGKPVWMLTPYCPDWRWLLERTDSPWYPSLRLFRQPKPNDWEGPIADICKALTTR